MAQTAHLSLCERRGSYDPAKSQGGRDPVQPRGSYDPAAGRRLMECVSEALRARHYSRRTERSYTCWIRRYIRFHHRRHPLEMGEREINRFLSHLAIRGKVSASTQNQAICALLFGSPPVYVGS